MTDSNENVIKIALVGCGAISKKHITAIGRLPDARIVGAYDISPEAVKQFESQMKIPGYTDIEKLVTEQNPDVFDIITPSGVHAQNVLDLVRFNRHFIVEKPLALRLDHIDKILETCAQSGIRVFVVKQNRFNPPVQKLKQALDLGRFGKMVMGTVRVRWSRNQDYYAQKKWRGTWAQDGGVFTNQASHHIDLLLWLMGDVESVMAKTATQLVDIEAEDTGIAILKFRNGALGIIEATTATRPKDLEGSISVLGEQGAVEIGGFFVNQLKAWNFADEHDMDKDVWDEFASVPKEPAWNHTEFFKNVMESIRQGKRGLIDGLEGRRSVELINAIYESAETGKEVALRFIPKECRLGIEE